MLKNNLIIISFLLIGIIKSQDRSGVKISVKQDFISGFEKQFLPLLAEELGKLSIPDAHIDMNAGISTLHILLSEIRFNIHNLQAENVQITLQEPNVVNVKAHGISGDGNLKLHFKLGFLGETDHVNINVKNINADVDAVLTTQESKKEPGKLLPSAYISRVNLDVDFDFHVNGSLIAFVANMVNSVIKKYINEQIQTTIKNLIIEQSAMYIADIVNQIPVYVPLGFKDLAIDYSLLATPKISNGFLTVYSNGAIVNHKNINNSYRRSEIAYKYSDLPDFDINGKSVQMFLSEYCIETAIHTLYESHLFEVTLLPEDIPKESPFQLNTTSLSILINGMSDVYGKDKKAKLFVNVTEIPTFDINQNLVNATVLTELTFYVLLDSGDWDQALKFSTNILAAGDAVVQTQGQISAHIHTLQLSKSELIETKIKDANVYNIEVVFNFSSKILIPILNEKFLKNITVKLPTFQGISFEDSTVDIPSDYVELNVSPIFGNVMIQSYLERKSLSIQSYLASLKFLRQ